MNPVITYIDSQLLALESLPVAAGTVYAEGSHVIGSWIAHTAIQPRLPLIVGGGAGLLL